MSIDVSKLAIEVTTSGVQEASKALGGLSTTTLNLDKRVEKLTDNLGKLMNATSATVAPTNLLSGAMAAITAALAQTSANALATARALTDITTGMGNLTTSANQSSNALQRHSSAAGTAMTTIKAMTAAMMAYGAVNFIKHTIEAGDAWVGMEAKLKIATGSTNNAKIAQQDLFDLAQKMRIPLEGVTKVFTRLQPAMAANGKTFEDTKNMVEGLSLALKLNGSTAAESASTMLQFSQAMQKGRLDGAEFNSIAENGSLVMRALSEHTGRSIGELKKMGSEGKLSFELIQEAMAKALPKWRAQFETLPITVSDGIVRIKNAWEKAAGEMSQEAGLNKGLVGALDTIEKLIPLIRDELIKAFVSCAEWVERNKIGIGLVWDQVKALAGDVWEIVTGFFAMMGAANDAANGTSFIADMIFVVRLGLAAAVDIVKLIGASFILVGADIVDFFLYPMYKAVGVLQTITEGVSGILGLLADGAEAAGFKGLAGGLRAGAGFVDQYAANAKRLGTELSGVTVGARKLAGEMMAGWESGNTEVNKLIEKEKSRVETEKELTAARNERHKMDAKARTEFDEAAARAAAGGKTGKVEDPKAVKEREKAVKEANKDIERQLDLYRNLATELDQLNKYGLEGKKVTKATQERLDIEAKLAGVLDPAVRRAYEYDLQVAIANQEIENLVKNKTDLLTVEKDGAKLQEASITAAEKEVRVLQDKINMYGKAKGSVEELALTQAKANLQAMIDGGESEATIDRQRRLVEVLGTVQDKASEFGKLEIGTKLDKFFDKDKVADFGNAFEKAFGKAGKSIDVLGKAFDKYNGKQKENAKQQEEINKLTGAEYYKQQEKMVAKAKDDELAYYESIAGASKNFFAEKTVAHKALAAVEQGIAMQRMMTTMQEAGISVSASLEKAGASTLAGAAKAFEQMGVYGFIGAAAIMAFMASKGVGGGGGGSSFKPISAEDRQKKQGTGTVLGDDSAKSESIARSLDRLRDNSNVGLTVSTDMLQSLRAIEHGLNGLTNQIAKTPGMTTGKNFGIATGESTGGGLFGTGLFGSKRKTEIMDTGLSINGKLSDLAVKQYVDVQNTKKTWYGKTSTSNSREMQNAGDEITGYITSVFKDINKSVITAGTALGQSASDMQARLNDLTIQTEISFKDLKGDELKKAIDAVIGAAADDMAQAAMPGIKMFQHSGEGLYETLVRVAAGQEQAKNALDGLGIAMVNIYAVQDSTGDIGAELVKQSIVIKEAGSEVGKIVNLLEGDVNELVDAYKSLKQLSGDLKLLNLGDVSLDLIRGAGGIDELSSAFGEFFDNVLEPAEQNALMQARLASEFGALGKTVPKTKAEFRDLVSQLQHGDAASQALAGRVLALAGAWGEAQDSADALLDKEKEAADKQKDLLDEYTDKVDKAKDTLKQAYDKEASALENVKEKMQGFSNSLAAFHDSLLSGDKSPLSALQKYQNAALEFEKVSAAAKGGDADAIAKFQKVAEEFLSTSRVVNASSASYMKDFDRVLADTDTLKVFTDSQVDQATEQLSLLEKQVSGLIDIKDSVLTVAQAIDALTAITAQAAGLPVPAASSGATGAPTGSAAADAAAGQAAVAKAQNADLINQVMTMTSELVALRADVARQNEQLIAAQFAAAEANAQLKARLDAEAAAQAAYGNNWTPGDAGQ